VRQTLQDKILNIDNTLGILDSLITDTPIKQYFFDEEPPKRKMSTFRDAQLYFFMISDYCSRLCSEIADLKDAMGIGTDRES